MDGRPDAVTRCGLIRPEAVQLAKSLGYLESEIVKIDGPSAQVGPGNGQLQLAFGGLARFSFFDQLDGSFGEGDDAFEGDSGFRLDLRIAVRGDVQCRHHPAVGTQWQHCDGLQPFICQYGREFGRQLLAQRVHQVASLDHLFLSRPRWMPRHPLDKGIGQAAMRSQADPASDLVAEVRPTAVETRQPERSGQKGFQTLLEVGGPEQLNRQIPLDF